MSTVLQRQEGNKAWMQLADSLATKFAVQREKRDKLFNNLTIGLEDSKRAGNDINGIHLNVGDTGSITGDYYDANGDKHANSAFSKLLQTQDISEQGYVNPNAPGGTTDKIVYGDEYNIYKKNREATLGEMADEKKHIVDMQKWVIEKAKAGTDTKILEAINDFNKNNNTNKKPEDLTPEEAQDIADKYEEKGGKVPKPEDNLNKIYKMSEKSGWNVGLSVAAAGKRVDNSDIEQSSYQETFTNPYYKIGKTSVEDLARLSNIWTAVNGEKGGPNPYDVMMVQAQKDQDAKVAAMSGYGTKIRNVKQGHIKMGLENSPSVSYSSQVAAKGSKTVVEAPKGTPNANDKFLSLKKSGTNEEFGRLQVTPDSKTVVSGSLDKGSLSSFFVQDDTKYIYNKFKDVLVTGPKYKWTQQQFDSWWETATNNTDHKTAIQSIDFAGLPTTVIPQVADNKKTYSAPTK